MKQPIRHHFDKKEFIEVKAKKNTNPCDYCDTRCMGWYQHEQCPAFKGYYLKEVKTLPDNKEQMIWEIMNTYHISCRELPIIEFNYYDMNNFLQLRNAVKFLIKHGDYEFSINAFKQFKTSTFYSLLKEKGLVE